MRIHALHRLVHRINAIRVLDSLRVRDDKFYKDGHFELHHRITFMPSPILVVKQGVVCIEGILASIDRHSLERDCSLHCEPIHRNSAE